MRKLNMKLGYRIRPRYLFIYAKFMYIMYILFGVVAWVGHIGGDVKRILHTMNDLNVNNEFNYCVSTNISNMNEGYYCNIVNVYKYILHAICIKKQYKVVY